MTSHAINALILMRADGHRGEWIPVTALAAHLGCGVAHIREHCEALHAGAQLQVERADGAASHGEIERVRSPERHQHD